MHRCRKSTVSIFRERWQQPRTSHPKTVVAIPVRDEAEHIRHCLAALNRQTEPPDAVVLLLNNCTDTTEAVARAVAPGMAFELHVISRILPPERANAGYARRLAMEFAAQRAGQDGIVLTTDADAVVPPDWVSRNLAGLLRGADLVCGKAVINPTDVPLIPAHLHADDRLEQRLMSLLDDMAWLIDPDPHDPPPRHTHHSGASLGVWVKWFERVGGVPAVASGEDRAFAAAIWQADGRIRHDPNIAVTVSGRVVGRADGGMATTLQRRLIQQDEFCDERVGSAELTVHTLSLRRRVRGAWRGQVAGAFLAADLGIDLASMTTALAAPCFGRAWTEIAAKSTVLQQSRIRFVDLPVEIEIAEGLLAKLSSREVMAAE